MRVIFNEELKQVADDLDRMAQDVRKAIKGAGDALLNQDVEAAQTVIDGDIEIDALESSVLDQCVKLLAKQNPVATICAWWFPPCVWPPHSSVWAIWPVTWPKPHAARTGCRNPGIRSTGICRHGRVPGQHRRSAGGHAHRPRCQDAEAIILADDKLDELHHRTFDLALSDEITRQQTVDIVLLGRFLERLAITPCPPPAVWSTSSPASTPPRSRPATKAPTSTDN